MQQQAVPETTRRPRDWLPSALSAKRAVSLHIWACDAADLGEAADRALRSFTARRWDVLDTVEHVGAPCPIRRTDTAALDLAVDYEVAWAAYPAAAS